MERQIEMLRILLDSTIEGVVVFNEEKRAIHANRNFSELFGYPEEEIIGKKAFDFIAPESHALVKEKIKLNDSGPYEARMLRKDGTKFWAILRGKDAVIDGEKVRISAIIDITAMKEKERKILYLANHDPLTGTYNRRFFQEVLAHKIETLRRDKLYGAILFIDLDDFKEINDTLGHDIGDAVLVKMTEMIGGCIRKSDIVARIGGDEFVVLLNLGTVSVNLAAIKAEMMTEKILDHIRKPIRIDHHEIRINASIGIAIIDRKSTTKDLMKFADIAMYQAKKTGKNRIVFFDKELQKNLEKRITTMTNLRKAVKNNDFRLHFQKQICLRNGAPQTIGVEALIRWIDRGKVIPPGDFIPLAEESGLSVEIGNYVLRSVGEILAKWKEDPVKKDYRISVNISPRQFEEESFIERVEEVVAFNDLDPQRLCLEITENLLVHDIEESCVKIGLLKEIGVSLSIDDFGTGFSSLMYLKKLPVDELKIDRSFIENIETNESDRIIVETIATLGKKFKINVIAEGVENEEQLHLLRDFGIVDFQGYLFSKPLDIEAIK